MTERLDVLIELYLLNEAGEEELAELEEMLRGDAGARRRLVMMAGVEAGLHRLGAESRGMVVRERTGRPWRWVAAMAAVVLVLIGLGVWWKVSDGRGAKTGAGVEVVEGAFEVNGKVVAGVELGTWMKAVGVSDVRMRDGTRARFEGGSEVVLREVGSGAAAAEVRAGAGRFEVTRKGAGEEAFVVETPMGRTRVLGTRFGVRVVHGAMVVEVEEGRVEVESEAEPERRWVVGEGDSRVILQKDALQGGREGEKKRRVIVGTFGGVKDGEIQLLRGDGRNATGYHLAPECVVVVDQRAGKVKEIPEGSAVSLVLTGGEGSSVGVLRAKGPTVTGKVVKVEGGVLTVGVGKERVREVTYGMVSGISVVKDGRAADASALQVGVLVRVQLTVRGDEAMEVTVGE